MYKYSSMIALVSLDWWSWLKSLNLKKLFLASAAILLIKKLNYSSCSSSEGCGCMNGGNIEWLLLIIRNYPLFILLSLATLNWKWDPSSLRRTNISSLYLIYIFLSSSERNTNNDSIFHLSNSSSFCKTLFSSFYSIYYTNIEKHEKNIYLMLYLV